MSDAAKLAHSLTEAQRRAILEAEPKRGGDPESLFLRKSFAMGLFQSLHDVGLVTIVMRGAMLNSSGLAVRQILQGDQ